MPNLFRRAGVSFILSRVLPLTALTVSAIAPGCSSAPPEPDEEPALGTTAQAMGGIEGTLEYALDAPWRMEPAKVSNQLVYAPIPIQMTIDDADQIADDSGSFLVPGTGGTFWSPTIGNACSLTITEGTTTTNVPIAAFAEIERVRGNWAFPGATQPNGPLRDVCTATSTTNCASLAAVNGTSEWHALALYTPAHVAPGGDVALTVQLDVMRGGFACGDDDLTHAYRLINHVRVHYGEAPLPRFNAAWAYGDLHYHSQGTDNEGEDGYNYRGVSRAMSAVGLDFLWATEHASASNQIVDADLALDAHVFSASSPQIEAHVKRGVLRDTDARRFNVLAGAAADTNRQAALRAGASSRVPQIFVGGEVDVIPEITHATYAYTYGSDVSYPVSNLCGGWHRDAEPASSLDCDDGVFRCADVSLVGGGLASLGVLENNISSCDAAELWQATTNPGGGTEYLMRDVQALNEYDFGREHMVYLPDPAATSPFVASETGTYGGATRRLVEDRAEGSVIHKGMLPEIEAKKGSVFLAHHMNAGVGSEGPNGPPWSASMLDKAWRSKAVLGLEFWNEDGRRSTKIGPSGHIEDGYVRDGNITKSNLYDTPRYALQGGTNGKFELIPFDLADGKYDKATYDVEATLYDGAVSWDRLNMQGLDPNLTKSLSWLAAGEPRKMFMAGGSDAHGDFNYRRTGYMTGTSEIIDMAIGTPRNLVMTGAPTTVVDPSKPSVLGAAQTLAAVRAGHFSVTDGAALRIVIDTNRNGVIDDTDAQMGDTATLGFSRDIPVLVEWASTPEFGEIETIELTLGVMDSATGRSRIYAGGLGTVQGARYPAITDSYLAGDGVYRYSHTANDYWFLDGTAVVIDPAPSEWSTMLSTHLRGVPSDMAGVRAYSLDVARLRAALDGTQGDRFFVRAVALGRVAGSPADCANPVSDGARRGLCTRRYAFTNPVWAKIPKLVWLGGGGPIGPVRDL